MRAIAAAAVFVLAALTAGCATGAPISAATLTPCSPAWALALGESGQSYRGDCAGRADEAALITVQNEAAAAFWAQQRVQSDPVAYADDWLAQLQSRRAGLQRAQRTAPVADRAAIAAEIAAVDQAVADLRAHRAEEARRTQAARALINQHRAQLADAAFAQR